ncbi:syntaxin 125 family protein [Dorcoceras hygrometricum]|uniref:Syntaxin 125 family protein n=1 Tax=Dorcoceras hygrometricum TaxID=472368 RepID=A0A2Z7CXY5_9LAMI|nr:syntaxin 125 family protein [Dorcoceras hygrometricum]
MNNSFNGSFKIYVEQSNHNGNPNNVESGRGNDPYTLEKFVNDVDNVKEDIETVEKIYNSLKESHVNIKTARTAKIMKDLRSRMSMDLDYLLKLAKQINKKFDALVRANAALRKLPGSGTASTDDNSRASMIAGLSESLKLMMRNFQTLRSQMEIEQKQVIEGRYLTITGERATEEGIDHLILSEGSDNSLLQAMQEQGRGAVLDAVVEIHERRDAMREIRKTLMSLHQILLGMAAPVEVPQPNGGGGPPSPVENFMPAAPAPPAAKGHLNDYERETRRQAYSAIAVSFAITLGLIIALLVTERDLFTNKATLK